MLIVDLSNKSFEIEDIPEKIIRQYVGGRGLGSTDYSICAKDSLERTIHCPRGY